MPKVSHKRSSHAQLGNLVRLLRRRALLSFEPAGNATHRPPAKMCSPFGSWLISPVIGKHAFVDDDFSWVLVREVLAVNADSFFASGCF